MKPMDELDPSVSDLASAPVSMEDVLTKIVEIVSDCHLFEVVSLTSAHVLTQEMRAMMTLALKVRADSMREPCMDADRMISQLSLEWDEKPNHSTEECMQNVINHVHDV